jgi:nitrogen fixation NifU-like protein
MDELRELYQDVILDHGKRPRNFRRPTQATCEAMGNNPMCGDQLMVFLELGPDGVIRDLGFVGKGCAISVASASMMTECVKGKTVDEGAAEGLDEELERLQVLSGVRAFPIRVKCATLAWHTMNAAMAGDAEVSTED